jgi:two-component system copper resistance phosphate regulon response regulator CusR
MRVLVAEDDERLAALLRKGLQESGISVDLASDGEQAVAMGRSDLYDVLLLDIVLPVRSGFDVIRQLRADGLDTPIMCLTARDALGDKVTGLDLGADDYLTKPFEFPELLARLRALGRRAPGVAPSVLTCGDLVMDPAMREVRRAGQAIDLTPKEYSLLEFLLKRQGSAVSRASVVDHVWGLNSEVLLSAVDVFVSRLRSKIDAPFGAPLIHTVRGVGYAVREGGSGE